MRVISGFLRARQFDAPPGHRTHPMSDKVRGGLFNVLGDISQLSVLDAFAGSGALSFEAISRGASSAVAVDIDKKAYKTLQKNTEVLGLKKHVKTVHANISSWSDRNLEKQFDLLFVAPPYDNLQLRILQKLVKHLKISGVYILDWPGKLEPPEFVGLQRIKQSTYGDAQLVFYKTSL